MCSYINGFFNPFGTGDALKRHWNFTWSDAWEFQFFFVFSKQILRLLFLHVRIMTCIFFRYDHKDFSSLSIWLYEWTYIHFLFAYCHLCVMDFSILSYMYYASLFVISLLLFPEIMSRNAVLSAVIQSSKKKKRSDTRFYCPDCDVPLCNPNCFNEYHTLKAFWCSHFDKSGKNKLFLKSWKILNFCSK